MVNKKFIEVDNFCSCRKWNMLLSCRDIVFFNERLCEETTQTS